MPRKPRPNLPGGIYHVTARGIDRRRLFVDDQDRRRYLGILGDVCAELRWKRLGYCLMDNHVHLLLETSDANLSRGMQRLQSSYAQRFNLRHDKSGHVFQGRFHATVIASDAQLVAATEYVAQNPVEAGLCDAPDGWGWTDVVIARARCRLSF